MSILVSTIRGMGLSLEFPGYGIYCALTLLIVRILFVDEETAQEIIDES